MVKKIRFYIKEFDFGQKIEYASIKNNIKIFMYKEK